VQFRHLVGALVLLVVCALPARAELVFFHDGRSMSVKGHRDDGNTLVLVMRGGGEIGCDRATIDRIAPDEVPYPEPEGARPASTDDRAANAPADVAAEPLAPSVAAYAAVIEAAAARHGVDARLVRAVIQVESAYKRNARSRKGAIGLMQLMPETARKYRVRNPYDPAANIEAGVAYLSSLLARFPKELALAAYNAGEAAVQRFGGVPPYAETRQYVSRILQLAAR
jgi:hypothetical protein